MRAALLTRYNRDYVTQKCRAALDQLRANIRQGKGRFLNDDAILDQVEAQIELVSRPGHIRVVNATGTILHTNLGRALLSTDRTTPGFDYLNLVEHTDQYSS